MKKQGWIDNPWNKHSRNNTDCSAYTQHAVCTQNVPVKMICNGVRKPTPPGWVRAAGYTCIRFRISISLVAESIFVFRWAMTWRGKEPYPFLIDAARGATFKISWTTLARFFVSPLLVMAWWRIVVEMLLSIVIFVVGIRELLRMLLSTEFHWFPRHIWKTALISSRLGERKVRRWLIRLSFSWLRPMLLFSGVTCREDDGAILSRLLLLIFRDIAIVFLFIILEVILVIQWVIREGIRAVKVPLMVRGSSIIPLPKTKNVIKNTKSGLPRSITKIF